jgi:hypothetical protein
VTDPIRWLDSSASHDYKYGKVETTTDLNSQQTYATTRSAASHAAGPTSSGNQATIADYHEAAVLPPIVLA